MTNRQDDAFGRRVVGFLVGALILEGLGGLYYAGELVNKIENNTAVIKQNSRAIDQLRSVNNRLIRIEVLIESVLASNIDAAKNIGIVRSEQERRGTMVEESFKHINNKDKHYHAGHATSRD